MTKEFAIGDREIIYKGTEVENIPTKYVVFWISVGDNSLTYKHMLPSARFAEFDDRQKAEKFFTKLATLAQNGGRYQSRYPQTVTKSWETSPNQVVRKLSPTSPNWMVSKTDQFHLS